MANDDHDASSPRPLSALARRRALKDAMAHEEAGERALAAQAFEQVGEHAQAAMLRLEAADEAPDLERRVHMLRAGAARNDGRSAQGRMLHRALARTLLVVAQGIPDGVRRRSFMLEAAHALDVADEGERSGQIYEELGMLEHAAVAYEAGGAIGRLEVALEVLERRRRQEAHAREVAETAQEAVRDGHRRLALTILRRMADVADPTTLAIPDGLDFRARLAALESRRTEAHTVRLGLRVPGAARAATLHVSSRLPMELGRAPDAHLSLPRPGISRAHARIQLWRDADQRRFEVLDLGSRAGTFLDGVPLEPGAATPLATGLPLSLGMAPPLDVFTQHDAHGDTLELHADADAGAESWLLIPSSGALLFGGIPLGVNLLFDDAFISIVAPSHTLALHGVSRPTGQRIELLRGDEILVQGPTHAFRLEVLG